MIRRNDTSIGLAMAWAQHRGDEVYLGDGWDPSERIAHLTRWDPDDYPCPGGTQYALDRGDPTR